MADPFLDGLSETDAAARWVRRLDAPPPRTQALVAEIDGVVGFASLGVARDSDDDQLGELFSLNVDPAHWGRGVGRALLTEARRELIELEFDSAVLWVLPSNLRAQRLYEAAGWERDGVERVGEALGVVVPEMRYSCSLSASKCSPRSPTSS